MAEKVDTGDIIAYFYVILTIIIIVAVFILLYYMVLGVAPKVLTNELPNLPINYNGIYPILLQGLIIVAGVILGLFGTLFFETLKKLVSSTGEYKISPISKTILYLVVLTLGLAVILLALFSIFFSINAMIHYGVVNTYITTQIDATNT